MKPVVFLPAAAKSLRRYRADAAKLIQKVESYARNPEAFANNVKALSGTPARRLRVGDFRIIFEETEDEIVVTKIGIRGEIYR